MADKIDLNKIREELAELKRQAQEKEQQIEEAIAETLNDLASKFSEMATKAGFTGETADFADILKGRKVDPEPEPEPKGKAKRQEKKKFLDDKGETVYSRKPRLTSKAVWDNGLKEQYEKNFKEKYPNGHPDD